MDHFIFHDYTWTPKLKRNFQNKGRTYEHHIGAESLVEQLDFELAPQK